MYMHKVQYYETDKMGITHHSNYIRWMEEARVDYLDRMGYGFDKLEEEGIVAPVVSLSCDYKKPSTFADEIAIDIKVVGYKGVKLRLKYEMKNQDGELVCIAQSSHGFIHEDGRPIRMKKEYPDFHEALMNELVEEE